MWYYKLLLFVAIPIFTKASFAQNLTPEFDFYYKWGTYGHFKVSSKENKVYIKVKHPDVYADTAIFFSKTEKDKIWNKLTEIDFFNYPDEYDGCDFDSDYTPKYSVLFKYILDNKSGALTIDSANTDTIWELPPIYNCDATTIPYAEYSFIIYSKNKIKSISCKGGIKIYRIENGKTIYINNPKYDKLMELGSLIREITVNKAGFKNLPESDLTYY